jgi:hypothetical protein
LIRKRGPKTEKIHKLAYSEFIPAQIREIERVIQFPIPQTKLMDPDIDTSILKVSHLIDIKIQSAARFSTPEKIQVPLIITGFPHLLFEDALLRRSIDTLPIYIQDSPDPSHALDENESEHDSNSEEMDFGPAAPFDPNGLDENDARMIEPVTADHRSNLGFSASHILIPSNFSSDDRIDSAADTIHGPDVESAKHVEEIIARADAVDASSIATTGEV